MTDQEPERRCATCRYFRTRLPDAASATVETECRIRAPTGDNGWPNVRPEDDCGEWDPKTVTDDALW